MRGISDKRDFVAGLMFTTFGLAVAWISSGYEIGSARAMGAGYLPLVLGGLLAVIGLVIAGAALRQGPPSLPRVSPRIDWQPLLAITATVVLFALVIQVAGVVLTTAAVVIVSRLARRGYAWWETLILAAALTAVSVAVFYYGLGLQFPLWPAFG